MFFVFRRPTTSCFQRFSCFVNRRRAVFSVFYVSSADDELFSAFLVFRRLTTGIFLQFLRFAHERRTVFGVFCLSLVSETLFLAIFEEKLQATACFRRFSLVACKRNVIFGVFCISLTSDERFSGFLVFPRGWEMQSAAFFGFPKCRKVNFQHFLCFPMLG